MKDSYGYLLKLAIVLIVLLLILQTSLEYFTTYEKFSFHESAAPADFKNAKLQYPHMSSMNNNAPFEKITVNLDKGVLGQILGIDLEKMLDSKHTAFQQDIVSENVDEEGNYIMPNYDYCDKRYWIPKDAIRSLCPSCDPDKL